MTSEQHVVFQKQKQFLHEFINKFLEFLTRSEPTRPAAIYRNLD